VEERGRGPWCHLIVVARHPPQQHNLAARRPAERDAAPRPRTHCALLGAPATATRADLARGGELHLLLLHVGSSTCRDLERLGTRGRREEEELQDHPSASTLASAHRKGRHCLHVEGQPEVVPPLPAGGGWSGTRGM
jgi:hypothetical protein